MSEGQERLPDESLIPIRRLGEFHLAGDIIVVNMLLGSKARKFVDEHKSRLNLRSVFKLREFNGDE